MYLQAILPNNFNPYAPARVRTEPQKPREVSQRCQERRKDRWLPSSDNKRLALEAVEVISWLTGPVVVAAVLLGG